MNPDRQRLPAQRRRGQVLVLLVPLLLVFFGMAALVIDLGLVRTTRARMTTAADTASLEGLRWRDQLPPGTAAGTDLDAARRAAAAAIVATQFSSAYPDRPFDAGPLFDLTHADAATGVDAGATVTPTTTGGHPVGYEPTLQPNMSNAPSGDLVSGTYTADARHTEGSVSVPTDPYSRDDFKPDPAGMNPPSTSMLARLRRSNEAAQEGVQSVGPTLPLLFGRGAAIGQGTGAYSVRRDGLTIRATSIAAARPVVYAGPPAAAYGIQGVVPVVLLRSAWESLLPAAAAQGTPAPVTITVVGTQLSVGSTVVGYSVSDAMTTIGSTTAAGGTPATATGYFPIVDDTLDPPRVVGFGWARLDLAAGTLSKLSTTGGAVAPWSASANLRDAWATLAGLDANTQSAVRSANATLKDPLLAAVSVRSTDVP